LTGSKTKEIVRNPLWTDDDANETINELIRWVILRRQSNNYLRFHRDRTQVVDHAYNMEVS